MAPIVIRSVQPSDFWKIAELRAESLGVAPESLFKKFQDEIAANMKSETWHMEIAEVEGLPVGYGRCQLYNAGKDSRFYDTINSLPNGWYLRGIVVAKNFRRNGIARLLTQSRLVWLQHRGSPIYCFLDSDEKVSISMYVSFGFKEVSRDWKFADRLRTDTGILLCCW